MLDFQTSSDIFSVQSMNSAVKKRHFLWISGWSLPTWFFDPLIALFPQDHHVVWDATVLLSPGADDLIQNLLHHNTRWIVVGHSLGFMQALAHFPASAIDAMIALAGFACFVQKPDLPNGIALKTLQAMHRAIAHDQARTLKTFWSASGLSPMTITQLMTTHTPQREFLRDGLTMMMRQDLRSSLHHRQHPIGVLTMDDDVITPRALFEDQFSALPCITWTSCANGGHAFPLTHPAWCHKQIDHILASNAAPTAHSNLKAKS